VGYAGAIYDGVRYMYYVPSQDRNVLRFYMIGDEFLNGSRLDTHNGRVRMNWWRLCFSMVFLMED